MYSHVNIETHQRTAVVKECKLYIRATLNQNMDLEQITKALEEKLAEANISVIEEKLDDRKLKALGLKTVLLPGSAANPDDPFYEPWAQTISDIIGRRLCGPHLSGKSLQKDPVPLCSFPDIPSSQYEFRCAPILMISEGPIWSFYPPCHARESPDCSPYVNNTTPCVMVKGIACKGDGNYYSNAYSLLDLSTRSYNVYGVVLYREDQALVDVTVSPPITKNSDEILYIYLRIDFPYD